MIEPTSQDSSINVFKEARKLLNERIGNHLRKEKMKLEKNSTKRKLPTIF